MSSVLLFLSHHVSYHDECARQLISCIEHIASRKRHSSALLLVQPPLNARHPSIAQIVSDGVEEDVCAINRSIDTALTLVHDSGLDRGARGRVQEGDSSLAEGVRVGKRTHEFERKGNSVVAVGVDDCATGAKAAVPVRHVADAGVGCTFAGATGGGGDCGSGDGAPGLSGRGAW